MAEVDIVADAHQVHVVLPNIANHHVSAPASKAAPYMGVEPMQISTVRNNNSKYGRKKQPRMQNGPRQGRNNNSGPSSSHATQNKSGVVCYNCGRPGHIARRYNFATRMQVSMLLSTRNDEVHDLNSERAVDPAIQLKCL